MELDEKKLKILNTVLNEEYVEGKTSLDGVDLAVLLQDSAKNGFLAKYIRSTEPTLNSLLFGGKVSPFTEKLGNPSPEQIETLKQAKRKLGGENWFSTGTFKYSPMTKGWVKQIIEIDEAMRSSQKVNNKPTTVYRGTVDVDQIRMEGLISTSLDKRIAVSKFLQPGGCLLKINLPANSPAFTMHLVAGVRGGAYKAEQEIVLPPCEYEIEHIYEEDYTYEDSDGIVVTDKIKVAELKVKPLNLAKEVLKAMKNLPEDFPEAFRNDPEFEFDESLKMLEDYIKNEVEMGKIKVGNEILEEMPNSEITSNKNDALSNEISQESKVEKVPKDELKKAIEDYEKENPKPEIDYKHVNTNHNQQQYEQSQKQQ